MEDIDRAIALSLSEEDQGGTTIIGECFDNIYLLP